MRFDSATPSSIVPRNAACGEPLVSGTFTPASAPRGTAARRDARALWGDVGGAGAGAGVAIGAGAGGGGLVPRGHLRTISNASGDGFFVAARY